MSLHITHRTGTVIVTAPAGTRDDWLAQLNTTFGDLLTQADRLVLDLSDVTLAPFQRVITFMEQLTTLASTAHCTLVLVADRLSARRILRATTTAVPIAVVPSLAIALDEHQAPTSTHSVMGAPAS